MTNTTVMSLEYEDAYKGNPTKIIKDGVTNTLIWQGKRLLNLNNIYNLVFNTIFNRFI